MGIIAAICTVLTLIGLLKLPYAFYMLLRTAFFVGAVVGIIEAHQKRKTWFAIFLFFAVLYNPLIPIHLRDKSLWIALNFITLTLYWIWHAESCQRKTA